MPRAKVGLCHEVIQVVPSGYGETTSCGANGDRVPLAPKGFDVLAYLVEHAGRVVTQDEILEALWPETY